MVSILPTNIRNFPGVGLSKRPAFKLGEKLIPKSLPSKDELRKAFPTRRGIDIPFTLALARPNFKLSSPGPRQPLGIKETEALLIKQQGIKVRIGDDTIEIQAKDDSGSLIFDSTGNPMMIKKRINLGELSKSTDELLAQIRANAATALTVSQFERNNLALVIGEVLERAKISGDWQKITAQNLLFMQQALRALKISKDPRTAGIDAIDGRFVDKREWEKNGALVIMWLLVNTAPLGATRLSLAAPIFGLSGNPLKLNSIQGTFDEGARQFQNRVIDLINVKFWRTLNDARTSVGIPIEGLPPGSTLPVISPFVGPVLTPEQISLMTGRPTTLPIPPGVEEIKVEGPELKIPDLPTRPVPTAVQTLATSASPEQILQTALEISGSEGVV